MSGDRLRPEDAFLELRNVLYEDDPSDPKQKQRLEVGALVFGGPAESLARRLLDYKKRLFGDLSLERLQDVRNILNRSFDRSAHSVDQFDPEPYLIGYLQGRIDQLEDLRDNL